MPDKLQNYPAHVRANWSTEPRLKVIDETLRQYQTQADPYKRILIACGLFFSLDHFLKQRPHGGVSSSLKSAWSWYDIESLYRATAETLSDSFGCTINALPRELELMYGRELTGLAISMDLGKRLARYMPRAEAEKYRLVFRDGRAYQWAHLDPQRQALGNRLVLAESEPFNSKAEMHGDEDSGAYRKFAFFVMSMDSEIYMTTHRRGNHNKADGIYHSSYLAGGAAKCAGSMLIQNGVIKAVRSDSGHYQPTDANMLACLQALRDIYRVPQFGEITVHDYDDDDRKLGVKALDFMARNGDWKQLWALRDANLQSNAATQPDKRRLEMGLPGRQSPPDVNAPPASIPYINTP